MLLLLTYQKNLPHTQKKLTVQWSIFRKLKGKFDIVSLTQMIILCFLSTHCLSNYPAALRSNLPGPPAMVVAGSHGTYFTAFMTNDRKIGNKVKWHKRQTVSSEWNITGAHLIKILILPLSHHKDKDMSKDGSQKWHTAELLKMALQQVHCHTSTNFGEIKRSSLIFSCSTLSWHAYLCISITQ